VGILARPTEAAVQSKSSLARIFPARPVEVFAPGLILTPRMTLRPLREGDRAEYLRTIAASRRHLQPCSCLHREDESDEQLFTRQLEMSRAGDQHGTAWRRVGVLSDGQIAGAFSLNSIARGLTFEADANWWVSADHAGKGLGQEGVQAMLDFAFGELPSGLGLHRIHAAIMPTNLPSIRLAQRVGLHKQPGARASIRIGGKWELHDLYARSVVDAAAEVPA